MFLRPNCPDSGRLIGKTRRNLPSKSRSRRAAFGRAFEPLEYRLMLTANISVTGISLVDTSFNPVASVSPGENVYVEVNYQTVDLPADASYNIAFTVNGYTLSTGPLTIGAGVAGTTNQPPYDWGQFKVGPGTNQISVTVDPGQTVAESSYSDNTLTASVNALPSAIAPLSYSVSQIRSAYGINNLPNFGSAFADGSGQTIAIVDEFNDPYIFSDLDAFDKGMNISSGNNLTLSQLYGSASSFLTVYNQSGVDITSQIASSGVGSVPPLDPRFATNSGSSWEGEETLDVEWAHAIAPGAHIDLIETSGSGAFGGLFVGAATAAAIPAVSVVSMSWSWNEGNFAGLPAEQALDSSTFTTPSGHTGVTFLASSGDAGFPASYPAYSPNVIGVGGTELTTDGYSYGSETAWSFGTPRPLVNGDSSYFSTGTWTPINQGFSSSATTAPAGSNAIAQWTTPITSADVGAYGGVELSATWVPAAVNATNASYSVDYIDGTDDIVMGSGLVDQTKAPVGTLVGATQFQYLGVYYPPDTNGRFVVRLDASTQNGTVCADSIGIAPAWATGGSTSVYEPEPSYQIGWQSSGARIAPDVAFDASINSGVTTYQSGYFPGSTNFQNGGFYGGFGTSLAAPCWAGILAIVDQGRVEAGGSPFDSSTDPTEALRGIYGLPDADYHDVTTGYNGLSAGVGYDDLTGRGTPIANLLVPDLVAYGLPVGLKFTTEPAAEITAGNPFTLTVAAEYPSGSVDQSYFGPVSIDIGANPGAGTLGGTLTVQAVNGVANFTSLTLNKAGVGYTLHAMGDGPTSANTDPFNVNAPVAAVSGNSQSIANGTTTTSATNNTAFGSTLLGTSLSETYTITNSGTAPLNLGTVSIGGANATAFSVTGQPASSVAPGGSTSFTVQFIPTIGGTSAATVSFAENDPIGSPFTFAVSGMAADQITGDGQSIADGATTTSPDNGTAFGTALVRGTPLSETYTITNNGTSVLTLSMVTIGGTNASDFKVLNQPASSVAPGGSTSFTVQFTPTAPGTRTATVSFTEDDPTTLTFAISGTAIATPSVVASDHGGVYSGNPFPASATAKGVGGVTVSGSFAFTYYVGSSVNGNGSSTPPTNVGTYTVVAAFTTTDPNYVNKSSAPLTFAISAATPSVVTSDPGGVYSGNPFPASATAKGIGGGTVSGSFAFTYYVGCNVNGRGSATAPTNAGTYTVVAAFTSTNSNYCNAKSAPLTFTISPATPTVASSDPSGPYTGHPFWATATANGIGGVTVSGNFVFTYYVGSSVSGTGSSTAPSAAGTYTVVAAFTSTNANYRNASSAPVTFVISPPAGGVISGAVDFDVTGNGLTSDDTPLAGVKVYLDTKNNGSWNSGEPSMTTLANGGYSFTGLAPGSYTVREVVSAGEVRTAPALSDHYTVSLSAGQTSIGNNFANAQTYNTSVVSNVVYLLNDPIAVTTLQGNTAEGDTVEVSFTVAAGTAPTPFSLVSYTAPSPTYVATQAAQQQVFNASSGTFGPGTYTLDVVIPHSYYQIDFVIGNVIDHLGPSGSSIFYSAQNRLISADNGGTHGPLANASRISGYAFLDANNNGKIDAGERPVAGTSVTLTGTDSSGHAVSQSALSDADGLYMFDNLPAGTYAVAETVPAGYTNGLATIGSVPGTVQTGKFSGIHLGAGIADANNNFGFQQVTGSPAAHKQAGTIAFWNGTSGQALIKALNGGPNATNLSSYLASNFPNMYGASAASHNLTGKTNAQVAAFYQQLYSASGPKLDAETMAVALATYVTNSSLAGNVATSYGFVVSTGGLATATFNVGVNGAAFGVNNNTVLTVLDLLTLTNTDAHKGILWDLYGNGSLSAAETILRLQADALFDAINNT